MTENERIKMLRVNYLNKMTLDEFGRRIGMGKSSMSAIENGHRSLTTQNRMAICREFNVREEWLTDGEGEPFEEPVDDPMEEIARRYNLTPKEQMLIAEFAALRPDVRAGILEYIQRAAAALNTEAQKKAEAEKLADQILMDKKAEADSSASNGAAGSASTA